MKKPSYTRFPSRLHRMSRLLFEEVPSLGATRRFLDGLFELLFPIREDRTLSEEAMEQRWESLQAEFCAIIAPLCETCQSGRCEEISARFFAAIPPLYVQLLGDARMYDACDPAAHGIEEVVLCYPGFYAVAVHRLAHEMHRLGVPVLPRMIAEYAHTQTGIDIHPGARIGRGFYIDHGTGVVIGETTIIGRNVRIYQGVTLGATFVEKGLSGKQRHPIIEDNVIIYAGSTILGGDTVVGHDTIIGGNVWLTQSVPPHSKVYHTPEITIRPQRRE